jgi:hypothetical protein
MKRLTKWIITAALAALALTAAGCSKSSEMSSMQSGAMTEIAAPQSAQSDGGHDSGMAKEDPVPFVRDMERTSQDILSQVKAGQVMDAQNSVSQLSGATDKALPHITDTALKERLSQSVIEIKTIVGSSPDVFELEEKIQMLQEDIKQAMEKLQGMNG